MFQYSPQGRGLVLVADTAICHFLLINGHPISAAIDGKVEILFPKPFTFVSKRDPKYDGKSDMWMEVEREPGSIVSKEERATAARRRMRRCGSLSPYFRSGRVAPAPSA